MCKFNDTCITSNNTRHVRSLYGVYDINHSDSYLDIHDGVIVISRFVNPSEIKDEVTAWVDTIPVNEILDEDDFSRDMRAILKSYKQEFWVEYVYLNKSGQHIITLEERVVYLPGDIFIEHTTPRD